ncbi:DUF3231 family protein [Aquibacillus rhizosphaerae]|uniref:DUF3231 family protein n=1 Tax=Aquibacillus rhizosphaerae TaxID=3051431 RepID=A0ABT7LBG6_9BACI|nr:DUF3231 family protein [Aquibacillus sp. LR5S19]MDL4843213.1 DUF3231 family protein [Aquibacillus sp. LR5S19]
MEQNQLPLTAPEIGSLWTQYMFDTMSICFIKYALEHIEDEDIREIYQIALVLSENHVEKIKEFFEGENQPIPQGFTEQDVNIHAPRLFQDSFYLYYMYIMTLQGLTGYSLSVSTSVREDFRNYYIKGYTETMQLFDKTIDTMLTKGTYTRPPVLTPPTSIDFVKQQSFLTGWFDERRPLTAMEIGDITFNMNKMHLHVALKVGFSQVVKSDKVRKFINRGTKMSNKHIELFEDIFREETLNSPMSMQSFVTDATEAPFSDKWMMYQVQLSTQVAIAFYGSSLSVSSRRDLAAMYITLTGELGKYAEDGANLMIENGWLEQPPLAPDRRHLTKGKRP